MLLGFYKLIWQILYPMLYLISRFNLPTQWMARERLSSGPGINKESIWFHCASLGEAKGLKGLLSHCNLSGHQLLLTASTKTGTDYLTSICSDLNCTPIVRIAPVDHSRLVQQFIAGNKVNLLCLYEVELWPHYINSCKSKNIPVLLVSARVGKRSLALYKIFKKSIVNLLDKLTWIQAIDNDHAKILSEITGKGISVGADYKFCSYFPSGYKRHKTSTQSKGLALVSLHMKELKILLPVIPDLMNQTPVFIFPRYMAELTYFSSSLMKFGFKKLSEDPDSKHILVDSYGKISQLLTRCSYALNGGTFIPVGGHNLWELLANVDSILTGPHFHNQKRLTKQLIEKGIRKIVNNPEELSTFWEHRANPVEIKDLIKETSRKVDKSRLEFIQELRVLGIT